MRQVAKVVFAVCVLVAGPAVAKDWCTANMPPDNLRQEPSVGYKVVLSNLDDLTFLCGWGGRPRQAGGGCVRYSGEDLTGKAWHSIFVRNDLNAEQTECIVIHEKAHLPPNNWDHGPSFRAYQDKEGNWRPSIGPFRRVTR